MDSDSLELPRYPLPSNKNVKLLSESGGTVALSRTTSLLPVTLTGIHETLFITQLLPKTNT